MTANEDVDLAAIITRATRVISDPGSVCHRARNESVPHWGARALLIAGLLNEDGPDA